MSRLFSTPNRTRQLEKTRVRSSSTPLVALHHHHTGDCTFSAGMVEIVHAAQKTMIRYLDAGATGARSPVSSPGGEGGGGTGSDSAVDGGGGSRREACEQLLRRQQERIEELERRLILPAVAAGAGTVVDHVCHAVEGAAAGSERPTLTI